MNGMRKASRAYQRRFGWTGWQRGMLRLSPRGFCILPQWADDVESLLIHLRLRAARRCLTCRMRDAHKFDCYHSWTIRDDLRRLRLWPARRG